MNDKEFIEHQKSKINSEYANIIGTESYERKRFLQIIEELETQLQKAQKEKSKHTRQEIIDLTYKFLREAESLPKNENSFCVNWAAVNCYDAVYTVPEEEKPYWIIKVDEASPDNGQFKNFLIRKFAEINIDVRDIIIEW